MRADSNQQSYQCHGCETNPQLGGITSAGERRAKMAILLLAAVHYTHRERPAFVIDVFETTVLDYFSLTTLHQTIADGGLNVINHVWFIYDDPSMQKGIRLSIKLRWLAGQPVRSFCR
jgi:hypothetical protein